jgi:hypothetical protein
MFQRLIGMNGVTASFDGTACHKIVAGATDAPPPER